MAIAFDSNSGSNPSNGTSATQSHACTGSNIALVVWLFIGNASDIVTGVTYNSVAMTQAKHLSRSGGTGQMYAYLLASAPAGTANIVVSASTTMTSIILYGESYTGVGTSEPDSSNTKFQSGISSFSWGTSVVASNCWLVGASQDTNGGSSAGSGTTKRSSVNSGFGQQCWDSNGTVGTGTQNLAITNGSSMSVDAIILSLSPYVAPVTSSELLLTGVG